VPISSKRVGAQGSGMEALHGAWFFVHCFNQCRINVKL
jgi:hypothetical protein